MSIQEEIKSELSDIQALATTGIAYSKAGINGKIVEVAAFGLIRRLSDVIAVMNEQPETKGQTFVTKDAIDELQNLRDKTVVNNLEIARLRREMETANKTIVEKTTKAIANAAAHRKVVLDNEALQIQLNALPDIRAVAAMKDTIHQHEARWNQRKKQTEEHTKGLRRQVEAAQQHRDNLQIEVNRLHSMPWVQYGSKEQFVNIKSRNEARKLVEDLCGVIGPMTSRELTQSGFNVFTNAMNIKKEWK